MDNLKLVSQEKLPQELVDKILDFWRKEKESVTGDGDCAQLDVSENSMGFDHYGYLEKYGNPGRSDWYDIEGELEEELFKYLPVDKSKTFGVGLLEINNGKLAPHIDPSDNRTHCINYTLIKGGNGVINRWYSLKEEFQHCVYEPSFVPYERITQIEEHKLQEHMWYQLNTSVIHSVENVEGTRLTISIPLAEEVA